MPINLLNEINLDSNLLRTGMIFGLVQVLFCMNFLAVLTKSI
jgi:hypothetical protein